MCGWCHGWLLQGRRVGLTLAEWMIDGELSIDVWAMDVARFGDWASPDWGTVKSTENYETLPKGRLQQTTALYDRLVAKGACMGQSFGLENALWFADGADDAWEDPTFELNRSHDYVAQECAAVRNAVGGIEIANFAKHSIKGPGARDWLNRTMAGFIPKPGRMTLTPMLTEKGRLYGDLTVACLGEEEFMLFGSDAMQDAHSRFFAKTLPDDVVHENQTQAWHCTFRVEIPRTAVAHQP